MKQKITYSTRQAVGQIGKDLNVARRKRRLSQRDMAAKMGVSISTVRRLEAGDTGISIGVLGMAFLALGEIRRFRDVVAPNRDEVGLMSDEHHLPQRVRRKKRRPPSSSSEEGEVKPGSRPVPPNKEKGEIGMGF
ncbi:helix-turn-helix domain-containing protein [Yunchengibacter salinarum]|uniref:helix-turn-helix domain-containing protein n=1 Tax=Yunchengibacter salinarum TaxID=3133399 RepID=UPI0035B5FD2E